MKIILFLLGLYACWWYVTRHYEFKDTLSYAKKHHEAAWAQPADYYVGLVYYHRSDYTNAQEAFTQLLTDYPTGHYEEDGLVYLEDSAEYNRDWESANKWVDQYLEDFPKGRDIDVMRKRKELLHYQHNMPQ